MATLTVRATDAEGHAATRTAAFTVASPPQAKVRIGYTSAVSPAGHYDQRLAVVSSYGVTARRVYANLTTAGNDAASVIADTISKGFLPIVSYKLGGVSISSALTGGADAAARATATYLAGLGVPVLATVWHEPNGNMTGAQYVTLQRRMTPIFQAKPSIGYGPILNGFLLDNQRATFESFLADDLLAVWDFVAEDTYQPTDSNGNPKPIHAGDRIAPLVQVLADRGVPYMPIGLGEFNDLTAASGRVTNEQILSCPTMSWACMWDNTSGAAVELSGDRLTAFQELKADSRALH